jgi:hypothetical protein
MNKELMTQEYHVYPFKVNLIFGHFNASTLKIESDGESVSLEIIDEKTKECVVEMMLTLSPDEVDVLISTLKLFKGRIERGLPTVIES